MEAMNSSLVKITCAEELSEKKSFSYPIDLLFPISEFAEKCLTTKDFQPTNELQIPFVNVAQCRSLLAFYYRLYTQSQFHNTNNLQEEETNGLVAQYRSSATITAHWSFDQHAHGPYAMPPPLPDLLNDEFPPLELEPLVVEPTPSTNPPSITTMAQLDKFWTQFFVESGTESIDGNSFGKQIELVRKWREYMIIPQTLVRHDGFDPFVDKQVFVNGKTDISTIRANIADWLTNRPIPFFMGTYKMVIANNQWIVLNVVNKQSVIFKIPAYQNITNVCKCEGSPFWVLSATQNDVTDQYSSLCKHEYRYIISLETFAFVGAPLVFRQTEILLHHAYAAQTMTFLDNSFVATIVSRSSVAIFNFLTGNLVTTLNYPDLPRSSQFVHLIYNDGILSVICSDDIKIDFVFNEIQRISKKDKENTQQDNKDKNQGTTCERKYEIQTIRTVRVVRPTDYSNYTDSDNHSYVLNNGNISDPSNDHTTIIHDSKVDKSTMGYFGRFVSKWWMPILGATIGLTCAIYKRNA